MRGKGIMDGTSGNPYVSKGKGREEFIQKIEEDCPKM